MIPKSPKPLPEPVAQPLLERPLAALPFKSTTQACA